MYIHTPVPNPFTLRGELRDFSDVYDLSYFASEGWQPDTPVQIDWIPGSREAGELVCTCLSCDMNHIDTLTGDEALDAAYRLQATHIKP